MSPLALPPEQRSARRWAVGGATVGALWALMACAPAAWLAHGLHRVTEGRLMLADPQGTIWSGSGELYLTGGADSRDAARLPGRLAWTLGWRQGAVEAHLHLACCSIAPLTLRVAPGWRRSVLTLPTADSNTAVLQLPTAWLSGLGTPFNTLQLSGAMRLSLHQVQVELGAPTPQWTGRMTLDLLQLGSRLSTVDPLGQYQLQVEGGQGLTVRLQTLDGALRIQGQGTVTDRLRFQGEAEASPGREAAMNNLLNIIGRRQGARSIITIG